MTQEQVDGVWDPESGPFSDAQKVAMRLAATQSNVVDDHTIPPDLLAELQHHYDDGQIVEMGMVIAILVGMARFLFSFDLADEQHGCALG